MTTLVQWLYYSGARDVDGLPVSSGSVRFFVPGTAKASSVVAYSDAAGTVPLTQPVALDAAGRAEVYLNVYAEIEVKDAAGSIRRDSANATRVMAAQTEVTWYTGVNTPAIRQLDVALAEIAAFMQAAAAVAPPSSGVLVEVATTNPSFEFTPTKTVNTFYASYAGAAGTLTITWPAGNPTIEANTQFIIMISTGPSATFSGVTIAAKIATITPPTTLEANKRYTATFISPPTNSTAGIYQITPWTVSA
jgi:hypothetical protein